mgnify:CR=1 FL=1
MTFRIGADIESTVPLMYTVRIIISYVPLFNTHAPIATYRAGSGGNVSKIARSNSPNERDIC